MSAKWDSNLSQLVTTWSAEPAGKPLFSVIIPTHQRATCRLSLTLQALAGQNFPKEDFEVIVVDDGSDIPPRKSVTSFRDILNISLVSQPRSGPAAARNKGASLAKGKYVVFTDDDCAPDSNWLTSIANTFTRYPSNMVGGKNLNAILDNIFATVTQLHLDFLLAHFNHDAAQPKFFVSHNLAFPADIFASMGGFDSEFFLGGEDRDICHRWLKSGYEASYDPNAIVYHLHELCFKSFLVQHFNYGCGAYRYRHKLALGERKQIKFESLKFYLRCILHPFAAKKSRKALICSILLLLSQIANAWGVLTVSTSSKYRRRKYYNF